LFCCFRIMARQDFSAADDIAVLHTTNVRLDWWSVCLPMLVV
jgi:hypothetical protein